MQRIRKTLANWVICLKCTSFLSTSRLNYFWSIGYSNRFLLLRLRIPQAHL
jgi:hypothetical protein